ncbi:hypothetical protein [Streptomyces sp. NPDC003077]|uniref:hypothetical protein n=1 Tax=Streptomyces sp. NPDC003077 TaxID=3154443 RepID=UPI0033BDB4F2
MTEDSTAQDRQLLRDYAGETRDPHVTALMGELLRHLDQVDFARTTGRTGGNTRGLGQGRYAVSYAHGAQMTRADHLAVLVHELTHVAVDQAYDSEMLNFPAPALSTAERQRVREETPGREEDFQNARLRNTGRQQRDAFVGLVVANGQRLVRELPSSGLSAERQRMVREKLTSHLQPRPFHEYDGVLSHLLTWCDLDGADRSSAFYRSLSAMVDQAAAWRAAGQIRTPRRRRGLFSRLGATLRKLTRGFRR